MDLANRVQVAQSNLEAVDPVVLGEQTPGAEGDDTDREEEPGNDRERQAHPVAAEPVEHGGPDCGPRQRALQAQGQARLSGARAPLGVEVPTRN